MSIWSEIQKRSSGEIKKEDFTVIYYDDNGKNKLEVIEEKTYKGYKYFICTFGHYPILDIRCNHGLSIFSGKDLVILKFDDKSYELSRTFLSNTSVKFIYTFDKEGDYNHNNSYDRCTGEGCKYTVQDVEKFAEMFIDKIIECEDERYDEYSMINGEQ